jgi:hypothetical protein
VKLPTKQEITDRLQVHFHELQDVKLGDCMEYAVQETLKDLGIPFYANIKFIVDGKEAEIDIYFPQYQLILEIKYWSPRVNRVETYWITGQYWVFQRLFKEFMKLPEPVRFIKIMNLEEASDFIYSLVHFNIQELHTLQRTPSQGLPVSP